MAGAVARRAMPTHRMKQGAMNGAPGQWRWAERSRIRAMPTHRMRQRRDEWGTQCGGPPPLIAMRPR